MSGNFCSSPTVAPHLQKEAGAVIATGSTMSEVDSSKVVMGGTITSNSTVEISVRGVVGGATVGDEGSDFEHMDYCMESPGAVTGEIGNEAKIGSGGGRALAEFIDLTGMTTDCNDAEYKEVMLKY